MNYASLRLLPLLLVMACAQPASEDSVEVSSAEPSTTDAGSDTASDDDFVEACLAALNWERDLCACVGRKAKAELSADGYAFQVASLREDDAETTRLRERMPLEEATQAGLFMVNAPRECAEEGA